MSLFLFRNTSVADIGRLWDRKRGFSLVELLAAITVFALLMLVVVQATQSTMQIIRINDRSLDTASQARMAFERLRSDFATLIQRPDIDILAGNPAQTNSNFLLLFFCRTTSYSSSTLSGGNRNLSLVGYQVASDPDNNQRLALRRSAKPLGWNTAGFSGLKSNGLPERLTDDDFPAGLIPSSSASPSDWDVLAPGIIRMVVGFILYPDNESVTLENNTTVTAKGQIVYSPPVRMLTPNDNTASAAYVDLNRISAIVVGVVALDTESIKLLTAAQTSELAQVFHTPNDTDSTLPVKAWSSIASAAAAMPSDIPLQARQAVHVFQCFLPVTPPWSKMP